MERVIQTVSKNEPCPAGGVRKLMRYSIYTQEFAYAHIYEIIITRITLSHTMYVSINLIKNVSEHVPDIHDTRVTSFMVHTA